MSEIWQLLVSNREWIFEGVGVFVLTGIFLGIRHLLITRRKNAKTTDGDHVSSKSDSIDSRENESQQPQSSSQKSQIGINMKNTKIRGRFNFIGNNNKVKVEGDKAKCDNS